MNKTLFRGILSSVLLCTTLLANFPQPNKPASAHLAQFKTNPALRRTLSVDTGYLPRLNSNRAIGEFDLELRQAWGGVYDCFYNKYKPTTLLGRVLWYGIVNLSTWGPTMAQMATYHELGHSARYRSLGIDTSFVNAGKAVWNVYQNGVENIGLDDVLSDDYFQTLFGTVAISSFTAAGWILSAVTFRPDKERLFVPQNENIYYDPSKLRSFGQKLKVELQKKKFDLKKDKDNIDLGEEMKVIFTPKTDVLIMAGGLNNQQDQSRRIENHLWYNDGDHFTTVGTYFWDKTWAGFQSLISKDRGYEDGQDTTRICNSYGRMGIDLTHEEIVTYSYLSYFLSAQTYANIYQIYQTLTTGENKVYAPEYWNIKIPNVALYFTTKGPTYNVSSGYRHGETWFFPLSIEFGLKESAWEAKVGVRKKFPSWHDSFIHGEIVFNSDAVGGSVYGGAVFNQTWNVQAGVTYHNAKTFEGERNIPSYQNGDSDIEAWIKLGVAY